MRLSTDTSSSKSRPSLASLIEKTIQEVGLQEWVRLTQENLQSDCPDPYLIPSRTEFLSRTKTDWLTFTRLIKDFLRDPQKTDWVEVISKSFGFFISWWLPHLDITFSPRGEKRNQLLLHRPFILYSQVALQWWQFIFVKVKDYPELRGEEKKGIEAFLKFLSSFEKGIENGTYRKDLAIKLFQSFLVFQKRGTLHVRIDPSFFQWIEKQIFWTAKRSES